MKKMLVLITAFTAIFISSSVFPAGQQQAKRLLDNLIQTLNNQSSILAGYLKHGDVEKLTPFAQDNSTTVAFAASFGLGLLYHGHYGVNADSQLAMHWLQEAFTHVCHGDYLWYPCCPYILYLIGNIYMHCDGFDDNGSRWRGFETFALAGEEIHRACKKPIENHLPKNIADDYPRIQKLMREATMDICLQWMQEFDQDQTLFTNPNHQFKLLMIGLLMNQPRALLYALRHGQGQAAFCLGNLTMNADVYWFLDVRKAIVDAGANQAQLLERLSRFCLYMRDDTQSFLRLDDNNNISEDSAIDIQYSLPGALAKLADKLQTDGTSVPDILNAIPVMVCCNTRKAKAYFTQAIQLCTTQAANINVSNHDQSFNAALLRYRKTNLQHWIAQSKRRLHVLSLILFAVGNGDWIIIDELSEAFDKYLSNQAKLNYGTAQPQRYINHLESICESHTHMTLAQLHEDQL